MSDELRPVWMFENPKTGRWEGHAPESSPLGQEPLCVVTHEAMRYTVDVRFALRGMGFEPKRWLPRPARYVPPWRPKTPGEVAAILAPKSQRTGE